MQPPAFSAGAAGGWPALVSQQQRQQAAAVGLGGSRDRHTSPSRTPRFLAVRPRDSLCFSEPRLSPEK